MNPAMFMINVNPDTLLFDSMETQLFAVIALRDRSRGIMIANHEAARTETVKVISVWRDELVANQKFSRSAPQSRVFLLQKCAAWVTEQLAGVSLDSVGN